MKQKGIWLRKGLALYHLAPSELALALQQRQAATPAMQATHVRMDLSEEPVRP